MADGMAADERKMEPDLDRVDTRDESPESVALTISNDKQGEDEESPPPKYDGAAPPAYKRTDFKGAIKKAEEDSSGRFDCMRRLCIVFCCSVGVCALLIVVMTVMPLVMIIMGGVYFHDCPRERFVPIYLVVWGAAAMVQSMVQSVEQVRKKKDERSIDDEVETTKRPNIVSSILGCFLVGWFCAGCYWIFHIHNDFTTDDPEADSYCNKTLYGFAFWLMVIKFAVAGLGLVGCCLCLCIACVCVKKCAN